MCGTGQDRGILQDVPVNRGATGRQVDVVSRRPIHHARFQFTVFQALDDATAKEHVAVGGEDEPAGGAPDPDVLRQKLQVLDSRIL